MHSKLVNVNELPVKVNGCLVLGLTLAIGKRSKIIWTSMDLTSQPNKLKIIIRQSIS